VTSSVGFGGSLDNTTPKRCSCDKANTRSGSAMGSRSPSLVTTRSLNEPQRRFLIDCNNTSKADDMATNYTATATRSGTWWAIEITSGLPDHMLGVTQTRRLSDVRRAAREVVADLLDVPIDRVGDIEISIDVPDDIDELIQMYRHADEVEAAARTQAANDRSRAAAGLLDAHLTMREAGILLGISHQRIKQLADRTVTGTP